MATLHPRVILVYNADGTTLGKLRYGYKKLFGQRSEGESACGNCEVTHGGLRLTETDAWRDAKKTMESSMGLVVQQLHRDELDERMRKIVETTRLPTVLYDDGTKMEEISSGSKQRLKTWWTPLRGP
ncbi:hypothetical protein FA10DRAFT_289331 [Acaromyces ingoldii]|uniref:Glutaredoxin domain-containing protein n=1 Tax=Acaromyces ingoldii TaxID=215250 RepID=A0A316YDQ9_9BASI|nr:hypothetical protein FA10DRAFT_289331 [Acaromyces ingoldii]PWN87271.1 hypothetical protein FA10DRAFT_289331 [Acaromyces ingoldii]